MSTRALALATSTLLIFLFMVCLGWEWRLAPLRPGGSWLIAKALPLLIAVPGLLRGRRYTYQWTSLLIIVYFAEGVVRAASEPGMSRALASIEAALALAVFALAVTFARRTAPAKATAKAED